MQNKKKILITGASGFIGSFLVEAALKQGMDTWAGVRASSSRRYLQQPELHFATLTFSNRAELERELSVLKTEMGGWDYIIHCAGATKCLHPADFDRINYVQTVDFVEALHTLNLVPAQFIFVSSLSVFGPIRESDYSPICETDTPKPNTAYGRSKLRAEQYLQSLQDFPYVIFRPTGVYGPREQDYFLMAKSIKQHLDFAVGHHRQDLTFVYVADLVAAIYLAIEAGVTRRSYFVSDGGVYSSRAFSDLIEKELGHPFVLHIKCPLNLLKILSLCAEFGARCLNKTSTLNSDKYCIMKQRNWQCDLTPACKELGYQPAYPLERGVKETIAWYKKEGWL